MAEGLERSETADVGEGTEVAEATESTKSLPFIVFAVSIGVVICVLPTWLILRLFTNKISFLQLVTLFLLQLVCVLLLQLSRHSEGVRRVVLMWSSILVGLGFLGGCVYLIMTLLDL